MHKALSCGVALGAASVILAIAACTNSPEQPPPSGNDGGKDQNVPDVSKTDGDTGAPNGCVPGDVTNFTPNWIPPKPASAACTQQAIDDYVAACIDDATATTQKCTAYQNANKSCAACLVTPETSTTYGAAIARSNGVISLNVGGCIALMSNDLSATGCGGKYEANRQCATASCDENCPLPQGDNAAFQKYLKCLSDAAKTKCVTYANAVCPTVDAGPTAACALDGATFVDNFKKLAPIFCASGG